jgi:hypothetical protein
MIFRNRNPCAGIGFITQVRALFATRRRNNDTDDASHAHDVRITRPFRNVGVYHRDVTGMTNGQ